MRNLSFLLAFFVVSGTAAVAETCDENKIEVRHNGVRAEFNIELSRTAAEQAEGLMFRDSMPQFAGMLFIYDRPHSVSFWMKNTLIPLDMLFIGPTGVVENIKNNATPLSTTPIFGGADIQYVLEINGGLANLLGLQAGAELRYAGFDQENAVWPCE